MPYILTSFKDKVGTILFNRSEKRNSFSNVMLTEIIDAFEEFQRKDARAVVIRAEKGAKVWSAGLDIGELPEPGRDPLSYNDAIECALRSVEEFPGPVFAMVEGGVWGAACDLCVTCDINIGTPTATFAITPAKIGVPYNSSGILRFLNVVGIRIAKEMLYTAMPMDALRALHHGLLNHLVPEAELEPFTYGMARQIAENSPLAIAIIKEQLRLLAGSHPLSPETFERIQGLRRRAYDSRDYIEGKRAFFEKRRADFAGK